MVTEVVIFQCDVFGARSHSWRVNEVNAPLVVLVDGAVDDWFGGVVVRFS